MTDKLTEKQFHEMARLGAVARLQQINTEIAQIHAAFPDVARTRRTRKARAATKRRTMSAAQREAVSARMKAYWASRRQAKAAEKTETPQAEPTPAPVEKAKARNPTRKRAARRKRAGKRAKG